MEPPDLSSSPSPELEEPSLLDEMSQASRSSDMATILARYDESEVVKAWAQLSSAQRSALLLVRFFPGSEINHDYDNDHELFTADPATQPPGADLPSAQ
jgi:hypothetical protein